MEPGALNLITDVTGLRVGNASDDVIKSGATVLIGDQPFVAAVSVMGGAPGTRETDLLAPDKTVQEVDALVLSGGSAFGLDAASGVADTLRAQGRGFNVGGQNVPIVPSAILFDLLNGGDKDWGDNPYKALGIDALKSAATQFDLGSVGAGAGGVTTSLKGGLGSASLVLECGITIGALVAVNAFGSVAVDGNFWAAPYEMNAEFGGRGMIQNPDPFYEPKPDKHLGENTTIAIVATDANLTQAQATRMATAAHDGMARAIVPSHTPYDGDLIFGVATGTHKITDEMLDPIHIGHAAATCLARAIARGVYEASVKDGDIQPTWKSKFTVS